MIHPYEPFAKNLASVEDLYSRKIIGWPFGKTIDAALNVKCTQGIIIPALHPGTTSREFIQGENFRTPETVYSECENLAA